MSLSRGISVLLHCERSKGHQESGHHRDTPLEHRTTTATPHTTAWAVGPLRQRSDGPLRAAPVPHCP